MKKLDLSNVSSPDEVPEILRAAAQEYYDAESELQTAWQDRNAGKIWGDFARILERAAASMDGAIRKRFG